MNGWDVGLNCKLGISWNTKEQSFKVYFWGEMMPLLKMDISGRKGQFSN